MSERISVNSATKLQNAAEFLQYCPETGILRWRVAKGRCPAGAIAGFDTGRGYLGVRLNGMCTYAHRLAFLIMTGRIPTFIDHINGDRSDNRWENLREVSSSENSRNMRRPVTNTSGVMGVIWNAKRRYWTARIKVSGKSIHLGNFQSIEEAQAARKKAEIAHGFHPNHGRVA